MIRLTCPKRDGGTIHYVNPSNIARITQASTSSQWHGIRSIVRLFDGAALECEETAEQVNNAVSVALAAQQKDNTA